MSTFRLTSDLIEQRLKILEPSDDLIFEVLAAYGLPKSSITRLRTGDLNKAERRGSILWKNKLFFTTVAPGSLVEAAAAAQKDPAILKLKPRFIIVSDGSRWIAYDSRMNQARSIGLAELSRHHDFFLPWAGIEKATITLDTPADIRAARRMGRLFDALRRDNPAMAAHDLNVFLARLLFCLFAEDSGIFEGGNIFTNLVASVSREDGSDLQAILGRLFVVMNTPLSAPARRELPEIYRPFPYVNGGLFARQTAVPAFSPKSRAAMVEAGGLDWEEINTDIFGNMFQACLDQNKRKTLGEHYTSVPNIMKVLRPLFLEELEKAAEAARGDRKAVDKLMKRMANMRFFDPACGSGNFLLIAFKEMRRIEMELLESVEEEGMRLLPTVDIGQFYGIEIDDFAHEIATLSMWLAEHQMNQEFSERFGRSVPALPLKRNENIVLGNALRMDWENVCPKEDKNAAPLIEVAYEKEFYEVYIFGNPPYAGTSMQTSEQKEDMAEVFSHWPCNYRGLDYVSCWFAKAWEYLMGTGNRCAFVTTNSITQGEQVANLWEPIFEKGFGIPFAHTSFRWANNAKYQAGVTCAIIGLMQEPIRTERFLISDGQMQEVDSITPYLQSGKAVFIHPSYRPVSSLPEMDYGNKPVDGGFLIIENDELQEFEENEPDALKYIKRLCGSAEYIKGIRRYCLWLKNVDFNTIENLPLVHKRVEQCRRKRLQSRDPGARKLAETPHLFRDTREGAAIIVPRHSSENRYYVPLGYLDDEYIISDAAFAVYGAEPWVFAIISSAMHMVWMRTTCGRLKTDYRYSAKLCYNTFPVKKLTAAEKTALNEAAIDVIVTRQKHTDMTLGDMYQPALMPDDLKQAHLRMDALVDSLYRRKPFHSDEERLECLFALYKEMTR